MFLVSFWFSSLSEFDVCKRKNMQKCVIIQITGQYFSSNLLTYLLTYLLTLLHGAGYSLKSWYSLNSSNSLSLWNPIVHCRAHKSPPRGPMLSQQNPVRPINPYIPKDHLLFQLLMSCQRISSGPRRFETFRNTLRSYGKWLLGPRPTPKLEDHPLTAVRDCLFSIFAATFRHLLALIRVQNK
jgi:hypothetical protein